MTANEKKIVKMWLAFKADPDGPNAAQLLKAIVNTPRNGLVRK
jgi:hypothetical protein